MSGSGTPSACAVALDHVRQVLDAAGAHRSVYSDTAVEIPDTLDPTMWWGEDSAPGDPPLAPPLELHARLQALGGVSAVAACPSLRAFLDERGVGYGAAAVDTAAEVREDGMSFAATIRDVSLPALSDDGREALLAWSFLHGPLAGRGSLSWLRRDDTGAWRHVSSAMLWIS